MCFVLQVSIYMLLHRYRRERAQIYLDMNGHPSGRELIFWAI